MPRWTPPPGYSAQDVAKKLAEDMAGVYGEAERHLIEAIAIQARTDARRSTDADERRAAALRELRESTDRIQERLREESGERVAELIQTAHEAGGRHALRQVRELGGISEERARQLARDIPGLDAAQLLTADLTSRLDNVQNRMTRWAEDAYQTAVAAATADRLLTGASIDHAQHRAWNDLLERGITGFVDAGGNGWNLASYVEMATRTSSARAWNDSHLASMQEAGIEVYTISDTGDACEACVVWQGQIVTEDGPTGTVQMEHATEDGVMVDVEIMGTLVEARADGWQHPNCRCTLLPYLPGVTRLQQPDLATAPDREEARERLREMERKVREYKAKEAGALTEEEREQHARKVAEWQGEIRDHLDETGLNRHRYREQLNLGHDDDLIGGGDILPPQQSPDPFGELPDRPGWDDVYAAELGTLSDDALEMRMRDAMGTGALDDATMAHLAAEMDRRDAARQQEASETEDERRARHMEELMDQGVPGHEAYAEAYGLDPERVLRQQLIDQLRAEGYQGRGFDELVRDSHRDYVYRSYLEAEDATRGVMLSRLGEQRGIDPQMLWRMAPQHARAYASEELLRWWAENGRITAEDWRAMLEGGGPDRSRGAGREFGV